MLLQSSFTEIRLQPPDEQPRATEERKKLTTAHKEKLEEQWGRL